MIGRLVREPLLHFLVLGAVLFVAYSRIAPPATGSSTILVSSDQRRSLEAQFVATWQRSPNEDEVKTLIDNYVREEVLYREGLAMGLDRDDPVVRNRIKLKMEFLGEDTLSVEPTDTELEQWFAANPSRFELPAQVSFTQVFFDPARHGDRLTTVVAEALTTLNAGTAPDRVGDRTMLPADATNATPRDIAREFGGAFADVVEALPVGSWAGPIRSTFGLHLVRVISRGHSRLPAFRDAYDVVKREWVRDRTVEVREKFYQSLRGRYTVTVEPPASAEVRVGSQ